MTLPIFQAASLSVDCGVAEFAHERPDTRNPLGSELREDYVRLLDYLEQDQSIRVLILRGSGGSFCAGGDVREMTARLENPALNGAELTRQRIQHANAWLHRLLNLKATVIAAVDGPAFGGGFSLALHADLMLASSQARYCMSFPRIGAMPDFGAHNLLVRVAGLGNARSLLFTGRSIGAHEARRMGIVHAIHPAAELISRARETARLLCEGPADVLADVKHLLNGEASLDYVSAGNFEAEAQGRAMASVYHRDAARRFRTRQPLAYDWDRLGDSLGFQEDEQ